MVAQRVRLLVLIAVLLSPGRAILADPINWTGGANDGSWNSPENWDTSFIPDMASDVSILAGASVSLDTPTTVNSLFLDTGTTLTLNNSLTLAPADSSVTVLSNRGVLNVNAAASLNLHTDQSTPDNSFGTIGVFDGGTLRLYTSGGGGYYAGATSIGSGAAGATLEIAGLAPSSALTLSAGFSGFATLTLSDSSHNAITGAAGDEQLVNDFDLTISGAGTIGHLGSFTNNGTLWATSSGANALVVSAPLTNWDGGMSTLTGGSYYADNSLWLKSIGSGSVGTLDSAFVSLGSGGLLTGDGESNALASLSKITNSGLELIGQSALTITPGAGTLSLRSDDTGSGIAVLSLDSSNLTVQGNLSNATVGQVPTLSLITVSNGSTLLVNGNMTQTSSFSFLDPPSSDLLVSQSSFGGFVPASTSVDASELHVTGDTTQTAAGISFSNGATGQFDGAFHNQDDSAHSIGSALSIDASNVTIKGEVTNDYWSVIELSGGSTLTAKAGFTNVGSLLLCGCSENKVTVETGDFHNDNGFTEVGQGNTLKITDGDYIQSDGETAVDGTLKAKNFMLNGGVLEGLGTIDGNLVNAGTDHPGDPGTQSILGDYSQLLNGLLLLDFAGTDPNTEFDNLFIGGNVSLGGSLEVDLIDGYTPVLGDVFKILQWNGTAPLAGNFASFILPTWNGLMFREVIGSNNIVLEVVSAEAQAPEPSTFAMAFAAAAGIAVLRRRYAARREN